MFNVFKEKDWSCPHCSFQNHRPTKHVGKVRYCKGCGRTTDVTEPTNQEQDVNTYDKVVTNDISSPTPQQVAVRYCIYLVAINQSDDEQCADLPWNFPTKCTGMKDGADNCTCGHAGK